MYCTDVADVTVMTRPKEFTDHAYRSGNGFMKRVPAPPIPSRNPAFPIYDNLVNRASPPSPDLPPPPDTHGNYVI